MIVIPAVDLRGGMAVRLTRGRVQEASVYGDPVEVAARMAEEGATWLHVVDLDAALEDGDNREMVRRIVEEARIPVQVGGGLRSAKAVDRAIEAGASRAILGTEAVQDPSFLRACVASHGDRIVAAVDTDGERVMVRGWTEPAGPYPDVLARLEEAGAVRFLVTAVDRDGTLEGPDLALYRRTAELTSAAVLAGGGVGSLDDLRELAATGVEGAVVGKALAERAFTVRQAAEAAGGRVMEGPP